MPKAPKLKSSRSMCSALCAMHLLVVLSFWGTVYRTDVREAGVSDFQRMLAGLRIRFANDILEAQSAKPQEKSINAINLTELEFADHLFAVPHDLWPRSKELMVNSTPEIRWKILKKRKVYLTYGENCCAYVLARACKGALSVGEMDDCLAYNSSVIDSEFKERHKTTLETRMGAGLWLWKPYIINRTLHEMADGEYLFYADAGVHIISPIHPLLVLLERLDANYSGILTFGVGFTQRQYCKRDAFVRQRCDTPACYDAGQVNGALSIWRRGPHALRVVQAWLRDCEDHQVMSHAHTHAHTHTNWRAHAHTHTRTHAHAHTHICTRTHTYTNKIDGILHGGVY
jgi:hypothetical protein